MSTIRPILVSISVELEREYISGRIFGKNGILSSADYTYTATRDGVLLGVTLYLTGIGDIVIDTATATITGTLCGECVTHRIRKGLANGILTYYVNVINATRPQSLRLSIL